MADESTEFDGVDDVINFTSNVFLTTGATSFIAVIRILAADGAWLSIMETEQPAGSVRPTMGRRNTDGIYFSHAAGLDSAGTIQAADNWMVVGVSRPAGAAQTVRVHKCVIGGANTHTNIGTTFGNDVTDATIMRFGGNDDFANIRIAACGAGAVNWADADFEGVKTAASTASIIALGTVAHAYDSKNGQLGTDLVGSCNAASRTGTTQSTDGPAGWTYFGAAAATSSLFGAFERRSPRRRVLERM